MKTKTQENRQESNEGRKMTIMRMTVMMMTVAVMVVGGGDDNGDII